MKDLMLEQFVLQEIMEINTFMTSIRLDGPTDRSMDGPVVHNLANKGLSENQPVIPKKGDEENQKVKPRRSLRKRIRPRDNAMESDGLSEKVQKMGKNMSDVEKYYLCKKVKRLPSTLETIFEEPKDQKDQTQYVSTRKFKRTIKFTEDLVAANRLKIRKRQSKAKKLPSSKCFLNRKKVPMEALLKKLSSLDSDKE